MVEPGGGATVKLKGGLNGVTNIKDGKYTKQWRVFTYVTNIYAKVLEQKKAFTYKEKSSTPTGLVWNSIMAAVSL